MVEKTPILRAVDLYSGIGGWSLGLRMAGISVVASYDKWEAANETNRFNNRHEVVTRDIRNLDLSELPDDIDIVVGSPPCTHFSYSNRGGSGDIDDGIQDIIRFLEVIDYLQPTQWAMENVPRVHRILNEELSVGGKLERFLHLKREMNIDVYPMQLHGVPQRRLRCIAGNFDARLLKSYREGSPEVTLGTVVEALNSDIIVDPIYGITLDRACLTDHLSDDMLSDEEVRINHAAKALHPVYNRMSFPDPLNKPVRTITATCTRVSRESIVIEMGRNSGAFRRLSIRERASLQGFPITYQLLGSSFTQKAAMVGNAIPPIFSFHVANALLGTPADQLPALPDVGERISSDAPPWSRTSSKARGLAVYPSTRRFRFAIPSLMLKSGVRFELSNTSPLGEINWHVMFVFGTPKHIHRLVPRFSVLEGQFQLGLEPICDQLSGSVGGLVSCLQGMDTEKLQARWSHRVSKGIHPFDLLDSIDEAAKKAQRVFSEHPATAAEFVVKAIREEFRESPSELKGVEKLLRNAPTVAAGLFVGAVINEYI